LEKGRLVMTELSDFMLDKTVTQKRKASGTGKSVEDWANILTNLKMAIYPAGAISIANFQSPFVSIKYSHLGYCLTSAATFQVGDRVVHGSVIYAVLEVRIWDTLYELKMGII